jgi:hypothetical protein
MMDSEGRRDYARTLLKLSEGGQLRLYPALSISKTPLKRRIRMISRYKKNTPLYTALALLLTVVIAAAGCTSAVETQSAQGQTAETQAASPSVQVAYSQIKTEKDFDSSDYIISGMGGNGEFIWQISLGSYDEAAVSNINKAAELLDGTVIARGDSLDLVALLGEITETNGWMATDEQGTETLYNAFLPGSFYSNDPAKMADHLGGGAEIVLIALAGAADAVGCDVALEAVDDSTLVGGVTITNDQYDTGLELRVSASKHMLIVAARDASLPYGKPVLFPPLD